MPHNIVTTFDDTAAKPITAWRCKYNTKVRYFPDNQIKISCFSKPIFNPHKVETVKPPKPEPLIMRVYDSEAEKFTLKTYADPTIFDSLREYDRESGAHVYKFIVGKTILDPITQKYIPIDIPRKSRDPSAEPFHIRNDSLKRTIDKAFEIGLANNFQYFITLTLDQTKINRYNRDEIYKKLRDWLSNRTRRNDMDYILFPEYHALREGETERAIHFHMLANANNLPLTDSGHQSKNGQPIYNLDGWKYGFSTVIKLDGNTAIVRYVTKYITKSNERIFGKSYLSGGKTLKREVPTEYTNYDYLSFQCDKEYLIPNAAMSVKYKTLDLDYAAAIVEEIDEMEETLLEYPA